MNKFLVGTFCGLFAGVGVSYAGVLSTSGNAEVVVPPSSLKAGDWESDTRISVFREQEGLLLDQDLAIDMSVPGIVNSSIASPGVIPKGTVVGSYYLHYDKVGRSTSFRGSGGAVTFDQDVVGLILFTANLDISDMDLGLPGAIYPTLELARGIIQEQGTDSVTLSPDRRTVSVDFQTAQWVDSIRVITVPEPALAGVGGLLAICVGALRRGRDAL